MPAKSPAQARFFGAVIGSKKGTLKDPSPELEKAASSLSMDQAKDFARKKSKNKQRRSLASAMLG